MSKKILYLSAFLSIAVLFHSCGDDDDVSSSNEDFFAVANRGSNTITFHDEDDLTLMGTTQLPDGTQPTYVVYSPERDRIYTGGLGNGMLYEISPTTYEVTRTLNVGLGAFHMWFNDSTDQLWVTNIGDTKTTTVVDLSTFTVETTLPIPTLNGVMLSSNAVQHDVTISPNGQFAYVSILDGEDTSYLVQYNTSTFAVENFAQFGGDGHLAFLGNRLFALAQNGNEIREYNYQTLELQNTIAFNGAHGVTSDGSNLFVVDLPGNRLARLNGSNNMIEGTVNTSSSASHNVAIDDDGDKLLLTYSGGSSTLVELYDVSGNTIASITTANSGTNPFGVWFVNR